MTWLPVLVCCAAAAQIMGLTAGTMVILPVVAKDLRASQSELQWLTDAYPLILAALLLPCGALLDRHGRRAGMLLGAAVLAVALAWTAAADSVGAALASRCLAGLGGALLFPGTLATSTAIVDPQTRRTVVGIWAGGLVLGAVVGIQICAVLTQLVSWQFAFAGMAIITVVLIVLMWRVVPETRAEHRVGLDPGGALLSLLGVAAVTAAVANGPVGGWLSGTTIMAGAVGLLLLGGFVGWELRQDHPLLDVRLFADGRFGGASVALFIMFFAHFSMAFVAFEYESYVLGWAPVKCALGIIPPAIPLAVLTPLSPHLAHRFGRSRVTVAGMFLMAGGLMVGAAYGASGTASYATFAVGAACFWAGMGVAMAPPTELIINAVPAAKQGVASAVNDLTREFGAAFGIAIAGSIFNTAYRRHVEAGLTLRGGSFDATVVDSPGSALAAAGRDGASGPASLIRDGLLAGWTWALAAAGAVTFVGAAFVWARFAAASRADRHGAPTRAPVAVPAET